MQRMNETAFAFDFQWFDQGERKEEIVDFLSELRLKIINWNWLKS